MGTKVAEDLRGKDPSDVYVHPEDRSLFSKAADKFRALNERYEDRSVLHDVGEGIFNFYRSYDTPQGYEYKKAINDTLALPYNIAAENLVRFPWAGISGIQNIDEGFGTGGGYLFDVAAEGLLGTKPMYEDNPMRFQHEIAYDEYGDPYQKAHESYAPYIDEAYNEYLPDLITEAAAREIEKKSDDLMDWNTYWHENPGGSEEEFKRIQYTNKMNLIDEKYGDQLYDYADKKYKKEMMEKYGIYNPGLLQGVEPDEMEAESMKMIEDMNLGILDPLVEHAVGSEGWEKPWWQYYNEDMKNPQLAGELVTGFGIPAAFRSMLKTGVKMGMPKSLQRGVMEAFPGTVAPLAKAGEFGMPRLSYRIPRKWGEYGPNQALWMAEKLGVAFDKTRPYGGQFIIPGTIAEMMDED